jgi:hypothetical protein
MTKSRPTPGVFISHSHQDNELVRDLARRLGDAGLRAFVDLTDRPAGADWKRTVRQHIRSSDAVLILLTPATLKSPWMLTELGMAEGFERLIVPVTAGLATRDLPALLQTYPVAPFDQVDSAIRMLCERLTTAAKD